MPTYEYACSACNHRFEEFQSIKAKALTVCPKCKKRKVKRLISTGGGFIFKGSGFYITDYRSDSYKAAAKNDAAPSATAPATGESKAPTNGSSPAKTESKPASSTGAKSEPKSSAKAGAK